MRTETAVVRAVEARLPTAYGDFRLIAYAEGSAGEPHLAPVTRIQGDGDAASRLVTAAFRGRLADPAERAAFLALLGQPTGR